MISLKQRLELLYSYIPDKKNKYEHISLNLVDIYFEKNNFYYIRSLFEKHIIYNKVNFIDQSYINKFFIDFNNEENSNKNKIDFYFEKIYNYINSTIFNIDYDTFKKRMHNIPYYVFNTLIYMFDKYDLKSLVITCFKYLFLEADEFIY